MDERTSIFTVVPNCGRTNTMRMRPSGWFLIQSTCPFSLIESSSLSMAKNPKTKHAKVKPDKKYKGFLHVGLQRSQNLTCVFAHLINCVRILKATPGWSAIAKAPIPSPAISGYPHLSRWSVGHVSYVSIVLPARATFVLSLTLASTLPSLHRFITQFPTSH